MTTNVKPCPVRSCESLILASRTVCFGHMMTLPDLDRDALRRLALHQYGSDEHRTAEADAVAYLDSLQPRRRRAS